MKSKLIRCSPIAIFLALPWSITLAGWKVEPATRFSEEVRVWDPAPELKLKFEWTGETNARHEAEGEGTLMWTDQNSDFVSSYEGTLKAGKRDGHGIWSHKGGANYEGSWKDNLRNGDGAYWYSDGSYYKGVFRDDKPEGKGLWIGSDGVIHEGTFVAGKKEGNFRTIHPDGTARDSVWKDDVEVNAPSPKISKPYVIVGLDRGAYQTDGQAQKDDDGNCGIITYLARREKDGLVIEPGWDLWQKWNRGGPMGSPEVGSDFEVGIFPPYLDVRLSNPEGTPLSIVSAEIEGISSHLDLEPLLDIGDVGSGAGGLLCGVANFKGTPVTSCEISYNVDVSEKGAKQRAYKFKESLSPFDDSAQFSIRDAVDSLGIDTKVIDLIEEHEKFTELNQENYDAEKAEAARHDLEKKVKAGLGKFAKDAIAEDGSISMSVYITGEMKVGWKDHKGEPASRIIKFAFSQTLAHLWPERGAGAASNGKFDIVLPDSGENYSRPFAFRKTVKPNSGERVTLRIGGSNPSRHTFRVRFTTADGSKIVSSPCKMTYLSRYGGGDTGEEDSE